MLKFLISVFLNIKNCRIAVLEKDSPELHNNYLIKIYYHIKPIIPRRLQLFFRRKLVFRNIKANDSFWPIDQDAACPPDGWEGWKNGKRFALVITHDIETERGHNKCHYLMEIEQKLGFRSSFNFVPERYRVSSQLRHNLTSKGFEVGVHGLNHDGKLYKSRNIFKERAIRINQYLKEWGSVGFRSPSMHNNLEWIHDLNIEYDASTFDTDPFEPLSQGARVIFPFWVSNDSTQSGYVELPYTLPQDFTLFVLMKEKNINIWQKKLDWIVEQGGMALLNVHPDYMNFDGGKLRLEEYPAKYYEEFLEYIKSKYEGQYWHVLPKDMTLFWSNRCNNLKH